MTAWYDEPDTPRPFIWWWAIAHRGHPAWYQRTLMAGDFAPGRLPLPRHVLTLDGERLEHDERPACGTCGEAPASADLEPIERKTGAAGFLGPYRAGMKKWPAATDPTRCWECNDPKAPATVTVRIHKAHQFGQTKRQPEGDEASIEVKVCAPCAAHLTREDATGRRG